MSLDIKLEAIDYIDIVEPPKTPTYMVCDGVTGPFDYHERPAAKSKLRRFLRYSDWYSQRKDLVRVYKYRAETNRYELIFSTQSQLGRAWTAKEISEDDVIKGVPWDY